jgi:flagellar hook-associated protein 1 FlgK
MSLSGALLSAVSGLRAAQTGVSTVSQNIANANTPGYVRAEVALAPNTQVGITGGVDIIGVRRAADRFLATASYIAEAARGSAAARSDILSRAQANFGDPSSATSLFAALDNYWSALTELGLDPASVLRRSDAVSALQATFAEVQRIGEALQDLTLEADQRIGEAVSEAQSLINRIHDLNIEINLNRRAGADTSSAENAQSALVDELSALMDVRATVAADGGLHVRTNGGALLVGIQPAQLSYTPNAAPFATHGAVTINEQLGYPTSIEPFLQGGEIHGLLQARDRDLVDLSEALGGFSAALADTLNQVHNENSTAPAPSMLTGRQTGLLGTDAIGFAGKATLAITDAGGVLRQRLNVDFDAQTITGEAPAGSYSFAGGAMVDFVTALNSAMGAASPPSGASFVDGVLSLNVGSGGGIAIQQDDADPSVRGGRGFSHFFGLNDLVSRATPLFFDTGLSGADLHGFNVNGELSFQVRDAAGRFIANRTIAISGALAGPAADMDDLISALNASGTGLGEYGAFALDSATGRVSFTANAGSSVTLVSDTTERGATGLSFSALNGIGPAATAGRALDIDVRSAIAGDPTRLAVARPDLSAAIGARIIEDGDGRGAAALEAARTTVRFFAASGALSAQNSTLAMYASRLGGEAGRMSSDAARAAKGAQAVATAAADRRAAVEGVSIDDELIKMTSYQNAYAAAARVIQAATDMLDVLMAVGYR